MEVLRCYRDSNGVTHWTTKRPRYSKRNTNYLPINISKLSDKHFNYKTLAIMSLYSIPYNGYVLLNRFILLDHVNEVEQLSNLKINTILRSMKKLAANDDLVKQRKGKLGHICYIIATNQSVKVDKDVLKQLINVGDNNLIKTYLFLLSQCNRYEKKAIPNAVIAQGIGLSPCNNSLQTITNLTNKLNDLGLIQKTKQTFMDNGIPKVFNKYIIK